MQYRFIEVTGAHRRTDLSGRAAHPRKLIIYAGVGWSRYFIPVDEHIISMEEIMTMDNGAALVAGGAIWMADIMQRRRTSGLLLTTVGIALLVNSLRGLAFGTPSSDRGARQK